MCNMSDINNNEYKPIFQDCNKFQSIGKCTHCQFLVACGILHDRLENGEYLTSSESKMIDEELTKINTDCGALQVFRSCSKCYFAKYCVNARNNIVEAYYNIKQKENK